MEGHKAAVDSLKYTGLNLMNHSAVNQQRDAAECLELILNKVSPRASEVSTKNLLCYLHYNKSECFVMIDLFMHRFSKDSWHTQ